MGDAVKVGFYILLFLPGFIFVQTRDYHVLRREKGQLEKTLEIVLWSAAIWILACGLPVFWPFPVAQAETLRVAYAAITSPPSSVPVWVSIINRNALTFFGLVCGWAFVLSNLWGVLRRTPLVDWVVKRFTKRDWYPSVALRFFSENVNRVVSVQTENGKYIGALIGAPDRADDTHILLTNVFFHPTGGEKIEAVAAMDSLLLKIDETSEISLFKQQHYVKNKSPSMVARVGARSKSLSKKAWAKSRGAMAHARNRIFEEIANGRRKDRSARSGRVRRRNVQSERRQKPFRDGSC